MELINDTPFSAAWLVGQINPPQWSMTCMVKATYQMIPNEQAVVADEQMDLTGDVHADSDLDKLLHYPSDFAYYKPHADVMLMGTCHAPGGEPASAVRVKLQVGGYQKTLAVVGDRIKKRLRPASEPQPFLTMPVTYEYSYGGKGFSSNPLGKGHQTVKMPDGAVVRSLPNILSPNEKRERGNPPYPAGFGPICQTWPQRIDKMGSYNDKWLKERWPWLPENFDWRFFNAAPEDQQFKEYLRGDETFLIENMHPTHPIFKCRLPGIQVRCFLQERIRATQNFREVSMNLDTFWIDMDQALFILVWRGQAKIKTEGLEEIDHLYFLSETLDHPAITLEEYQDMLTAALIAREEEDEEFEPEEEEEDLADDEEIAMPSEALGPAPVAILPVGQIAGQDESVSSGPGISETGIETSAVPSKPEATEIFEIEEPPEAPGGEISLDQLMERIQRKESLEEAELSNLDLTGVDLSHMNLRGAVLERVLLRKANLAHADLSGATLVGLDIQDADCRWADFTEADLADSLLIRSDFSEAVMRDADLMRADVRKACLEKVVAEGADFAEADLSCATFREADLTGADLSFCRLHHTDFSNANLTDASLESAWGRNIQADAARVDMIKAAGVNFSDGNFINIAGRETVWEGGEFFGCNFSKARLAGAEFSSAYLGWSKFHATDLTDAVFDEASLVHADFFRTKFLNASIQKADLTNTNFTESNLYEVNLCFSSTKGTRFEGANLMMLKHTMDRS